MLCNFVQNVQNTKWTSILSCFTSLHIWLISNVKHAYIEDLLIHSYKTGDEKPYIRRNKWNTYITKFLSINIHNRSTKTVQNSLYVLTKNSKMFIIFSNKYIITSRNSSFNITSPTFKAFSLGYKLPEYVDYITNKYLKLVLHKAFKLNLTVIELQVIGKCFIKTNEKLVILTYYKTHSIQFKFCGVYSLFPLYLPYRIVVILYSNNYMFKAFNSSGSIISSNVVKTLQIVSFKSIISVFYVLSYIFKNMSIYKSLNMVVDVFDGPGMKSPKSRYGYNIASLKLSSFQCVIQTQFILNTSTNFKEHIYYVGRTFPPIYMNVSDKGGKQFFLDSGSRFGLYVYRITVSRGYNVNITLKHFTYTGEESNICQYGGISIIEYKASKFLICNKGYERGTFYLHYKQYIYIHTKAILVIYSYKYYSHIKISFVIDQTNCSLLLLNPCEGHETIKNSLGAHYHISFDTEQCSILDMTTTDERIFGPKNYLYCMVSLDFIPTDLITQGFFKISVSGYFRRLHGLTYIDRIGHAELHRPDKRVFTWWNPFDELTGPFIAIDYGFDKVKMYSTDDVLCTFDMIVDSHETLPFYSSVASLIYSWVQIYLEPIKVTPKALQINKNVLPITHLIRRSIYEAIYFEVDRSEIQRKNKTWFQIKGQTTQLTRPSLDAVVSFDIMTPFNDHFKTMILSVPGNLHSLVAKLHQNKMSNMVFKWLMRPKSDFHLSGGQHRTMAGVH